MEGRDFDRPPVVIWKGVVKANLHTLLAGCSLYSSGAGGFGRVPAIPNLVRVRQPANPNSRDSMRMTEMYSGSPSAIKARINRQFGLSEPRS